MNPPLKLWIWIFRRAINHSSPAEAKFRAKPEEYSQLIRDGDAAGLMRLLTDEAVEDRVVQRVRRKAATYGQDLAPGEGEIFLLLGELSFVKRYRSLLCI